MESLNSNVCHLEAIAIIKKGVFLPLSSLKLTNVIFLLIRACEEWIHVNAESGPINQFEYPQGEEIRTTHGKDTSGHRVSIKVYKDADHSGILSVPALIADLIKQATASDQITLQ